MRFGLHGRERGKEPSLSTKELIQQATTLDELCHRIQNHNITLKESATTYTAKDLLHQIDNALLDFSEETFRTLPQTDDFRSTVRDLVISEIQEKLKQLSQTERILQEATNLADLRNRIKDHYIYLPVVGSRNRVYTPKQLTDLITAAEKDPQDSLHRVTRACGLLDKVFSLIYPEERLMRLPKVVQNNMYEYKKDGEKRLANTIHTLSSLKRDFKKEGIDVVDKTIYGNRVVFEIRIPEVQETILLYRSSGTATPNLKKKGEWFAIGGFYRQRGSMSIGPDYWFIKNDESIQACKWREAEAAGKKLTFLQQMTRYFETHFRLRSTSN